MPERDPQAPQPQDVLRTRGEPELRGFLSLAQVSVLLADKSQVGKGGRNVDQRFAGLFRQLFPDVRSGRLSQS